MRYFALPDDVAAALYRALATSTDTPAPGTLPAPAPAPAPIPAPQRPPASTLETIMAGVWYTAAEAGFPNGWPPRDPDQSAATHQDTDYIHTNSRGGPGGGYYTFPGFKERSEKPLRDITATANPRSGLGLLAVLMGVGLTQEFRTRAYNAIIAGGGNADTINANAQADPDWNAAVWQMLNGVPPNTAELQAAKAVADAL